MPTRRRPKPSEVSLDRARLADERRRRYAAVLQSHPAVVEVPGHSGAFYLCRRLDPVDLLALGTLPQPLTQVVRRMMRSGAMEAAGETDEDYDRYLQTCAAVVRLAALVPPPAFLAGEVGIDDLDPADCLPLFGSPDEPLQPGQFIMTGYGQPPAPAGAPTLSIGINDLTFIVTVLLAAGPPSAPLLQFRFEPGSAVASLDDVADGALDRAPVAAGADS